MDGPVRVPLDERRVLERYAAIVLELAELAQRGACVVEMVERDDDELVHVSLLLAGG
jgi:hypothetical protein